MYGQYNKYGLCWYCELLRLNNLNQYPSQSFLRHIFDCLFVFETGLSCFTHLFYLVILLCLTQPLMFFFCNIDFDFQSLNFMFGAEMVHFNSCTSSFSLLISSTSNWFSMTLQADSPISAQSGCLFVAILKFVQIIWWPELGFSWGVQVRFGYLPLHVPMHYSFQVF